MERKLTQQIERIEAVTRPLDARQRRQPRVDGGWSINEILAHLARTNGTYAEQLERIASEATTDRHRAHGWSPTIGGRILRWSVTTSLSIRAPKTFRPAMLEYAGDPLEAFVESQRTLLALLAQMRNLSWSILRCSSPASSLVRLNPGDVFLVLAEHVDRHMTQLERQRDVVVGAETASP